MNFCSENGGLLLPSFDKSDPKTNQDVWSVLEDYSKEMSESFRIV